MKRFTAFFCSILILGFVSQAFAEYIIEYSYVQHRRYEDGRSFNRLSFAILDETTGTRVRQDLTTSVRLFKRGTEIGLSNGNFQAHDLGYGVNYDTYNGKWSYDPTLYDDSYYTYTIDLDRLTIGTYRLVVIYNGVRLVTTCTFNGLVNLPVVKAEKITSSVDAEGNLYCSWVIPKKLYRITGVDSPPSISARADLNVFQNGEYIGYISARLPAHMGGIFYPARILDQIRAMGGDSYNFQVMLRTNDNNNRTYSNGIDLNI